MFPLCEINFQHLDGNYIPVLRALYLYLWYYPSPIEPRYALPLQTVLIQISWLLKKPTDLDLHCLSLSMWICIKNLDQVIWLTEN